MKFDAKRRLETVFIEMSADEAGELYAELYRLSADELMKPYPKKGQIAILMSILVSAEAPGT